MNILQLSLRENPLVVRFVSDMSHNPASLLELSARSIKLYSVPFDLGDIPRSLVDYLSSATHCVNPKCKGKKEEFVMFLVFCVSVSGVVLLLKTFVFFSDRLFMYGMSINCVGTVPSCSVYLYSETDIQTDGKILTFLGSL